MNDLIQEVDNVLLDFIAGQVEVASFEQYMALERIAVILNKYRTKKASDLEDHRSSTLGASSMRQEALDRLLED